MTRFVQSCAAATLVAAGAVVADADLFTDYFDTGVRIDMPGIGAGSFGTSGAVLGDGRLIAATGNEVYLEAAVGSGVFDVVATFDPAQMSGAVDPSFFSVSPGGDRLAVGGGFGKPVAVFDLGALGTPGAPSQLVAGVNADYFSVDHFDAAWYDETNLAITAGDFGAPAFVSLLDTTSDPNAPVNPLIVDNIGGASSGIAFDGEGVLYTGNGFAGDGPSDTGDVKAIPFADWQDGLVGDPADFENDGVFLVDLLSAGSLGFDAAGNFYVGGGDSFSGDSGYFALVDAQALADALAGLDPVDMNDPAEVRTFDPEGMGGVGSYTVNYNAVTGALYGGWAEGFDPGDAVTWAVYRVPTPASALLLAVGGTLLWRRRDA